MTAEQIKTKLISAGVNNLKQFGYPEVNSINILTDVVYSQFFQSMLEDNKGKGGKEVDTAINEILDEIKGN